MSVKPIAITHQVFDALAHDYAGMPECDDNAEDLWDPLFAKADKNHILYDKLFYRYMTQRLAGFDDSTLCFLPGPNCSYTPQTCGFETRRIEDRLVVMRAGLDTRLKAGDTITSINHQTLDEYIAMTPGNPFGTVNTQRQLWEPVITTATSFTVMDRTGKTKELKTRLFPRSSIESAPCTLSTLEDGSVLLTVNKLDDLSAAHLLETHANEVAQAPRLIMDLRACSGGDETCAHPLLNYAFDESTNLLEVQAPEAILTNYTAANCDRREKQIMQLRTLAQVNPGAVNPETLTWMDDNLELVRSMRGKGYVEESVSPNDVPIAAGPAGQKLVLLTDVTTSDAAEWFVKVTKNSSRVTTIGRATRGSLDYSNPVSMTFEDRFIFVYPMSKTRAAAQGMGIRGRGIAPSITVDLSEQEATEDIMLKRAKEI